jgi:hypothetical protein
MSAAIERPEWVLGQFGEAGWKLPTKFPITKANSFKELVLAGRIL